VGLQRQKQRGPEGAGERFAPGAQEIEPFGLGEPLTRGPEIRERPAHQVDLQRLLFGGLGVEILLPAGQHAEEEVSRFLASR